jgi:pentapeptide MXKDX repeat protein
MIARMMTMAIAATLVLGTATFPTVTFAEMLKKEETKKDTTKKEETKKDETKKATTPQQQRMKDCGAEWQTMKKDGRAKGTTWAKFSKECLSKK